MVKRGTIIQNLRISRLSYILLRQHVIPRYKSGALGMDVSLQVRMPTCQQLRIAIAKKTQFSVTEKLKTQ